MSSEKYKSIFSAAAEKSRLGVLSRLRVRSALRNWGRMIPEMDNHTVGQIIQQFACEQAVEAGLMAPANVAADDPKIGRASCRERV
jgi:hypothetical protein